MNVVQFAIYTDWQVLPPKKTRPDYSVSIPNWA